MKEEVTCIPKETYQTLMDDRKELMLEVINLGKIAADLSKRHDDLLFALNRLLLACPTTLSCIDFHHKKADRHEMIYECGLVKEYMLALANARVIIEQSRKTNVTKDDAV